MKVKNIKFDGTELLGVQTDDNKIYMGINKFLEEIGFKDKANLQYQRNKMLDDGYLKMGITTLILTDNLNRQQETYVIELNYIPTAMVKFNPDDLHKKSKSLTEAEKIMYRGKLLKYQEKAKDILAKEFLTDTENAREFKQDYNFIEQLQNDLTTLKNDNIELKAEMSELKHTNSLFLDNLTINSHQAQKLNKAARDRINIILGGTQSKKYKKESRRYFKQLWLNVCDKWKVTSYKDINPISIPDVYTFINNWSMV